MTFIGLVFVVILALGLSVDTFAAAVTKGATLRALSVREKLRVAGIFAGCAVVAPAIGWGFGYLASGVITEFDHWIAFGLLGAVGAHMVWNGLHATDVVDRDLSTPHVLVTAVATNVDAVAVGIGLAFVDVNILLVCVGVGIVTVAAVYGGLWVGRKTGSLLGHRAEVVGGLVLIALGVKILVMHLLG